VTYLVTSSSVAGAQRQVHDLALGIHERGWDTRIISMLPLDEAFADLPARGIETQTLGMTQGIPDPRALWKLRSMLLEWRPDVLHGHMVHSNLLARLSRLLVPTRVVVCTMHNQNEGPQWRYLAYRLTDPLCDLTTTVSGVAVDEAVRRHAVSRRKVTLVPNGIDASGYDRDDAVRRSTRASLGITDEFLWFAAGRLSEAKDYPNMVQAFKHVRSVQPSTRLRIAGIGPTQDSLEALVSREGLTGDIELLGLRADVPALMQAADGFVMSSAWEGLPMVLLEAAASSLPIVVTDVGGSRDVIEHGTSGYITPPADSQALGDAMLQVMALAPSERDAMGAAGRARVTSVFDLEAVTNRWQGIYRDLLKAA
jgi:glycosyltransferase involved in cell wall biosynthesis